MPTQIETEKAVLENLPQPMKFLILVALAAGIFFAYKHFTDGYEKVEGEWVIKPKYNNFVDKKVTSFEECTVYELRATADGYYECKHCLYSVFFLKAGEVWKIGKTCSKEERYDEIYYLQNNVKYHPVFAGSSAECEIEEVRRIAAYALSPENMQRPDPTRLQINKKRHKLLYPPKNTGLR